MAESHTFHKESDYVMEELISQGLDDELMNQFVELADNTPLHMVTILFNLLYLFLLCFKC